MGGRKYNGCLIPCGYKPEGCGFDSRIYHWNFSFTYPLRHNYGPEVDTTSNKNEYQEYFFVIKAFGALAWQPYHPHVPTVLKSGRLNPLEPSGPVQACNGMALPFYIGWEVTNIVKNKVFSMLEGYAIVADAEIKKNSTRRKYNWLGGELIYPQRWATGTYCVSAGAILAVVASSCQSSSPNRKECDLTVTLLSCFRCRMVVPPHQQMEYSTLIPNYSAPSSVCTSDSGGGSSDQSRMRTIRLHRRLTGSHSGPPNFGFSVRGGREHGTGFFVSAVEQGSEAQCQGLKVSFLQNLQIL